MAEIIKQPMSVADHSGKEYFFTKFETDIQSAFDEVSETGGFKTINVKSLIKKGSSFPKGDYFLPLQSNHVSVFLNYKDILFQKLKKISYIDEVEYGVNGNLIIFLNRPLVYQTIIYQLLQCDDKYGSIETTKSTLVLVTDAVVEDFHKLRIELITNHIISFLIFNNVKIYCNKYNCYTNPLPPSKLKEEILCKENCPKIELYEELKIKAKQSVWRKFRSDKQEYLCLDGAKYIMDNHLSVKYGKGINEISLEKNENCGILKQTSFIKHMVDSHLPNIPDYIIHIVNYQQKFMSHKSGLLYDMLEKSESNQLYLDVQGTNVKFDSEVSVCDFKAVQKEGIVSAMVHKYDSNITEDKLWASRMDTLVDSAIKYEFLKINLNMPLKLQVLHHSTSEKNLGIFIQYNFARLSNLFRNFETKVKEQFYDPLPELSEIDFKVLKLDEEWNLFSYVLHFPKLIQSIFDSLFCNIAVKSQFPVNRIFIMLSDLCHHLSLYYSRVRILGSQQTQLQRLMQARLWLLKGIHKILMNAFTLLGIEGLDLM